MYLMFVFSINIGSAFIDFFDILFGAIFVQGFGNLLTSWGTPEWLKTILADGIGGGIQTVSTFIPVIACLFSFRFHSGRFGLYVACGLCDGPNDAAFWTAR